MSRIKSAQASYFYKPASGDTPAEVIEVLNSSSWCIQVPTHEFDLKFSSFFQRDMTALERKEFGKKQTWRIFTSWKELKQMQRKTGIDEEIVQQLLQFRSNYTLAEELAA